MTTELLLPCTLFAVRLRPGRKGVPTPLEQAVLYFILSCDPTATRFDDIRKFTGLGRALVMDMLVDFVRRRWIALQGNGEFKVTDLARKSLEKAEREKTDPQELGSTEAVGQRHVMCYDLIGGRIGKLDRQHLQKNASGENVLPRTRSGNGDSYSDKGYPKKLDEFETDPYLKDKIHRALQSNARFRAEAASLDLRGTVHVSQEPIARPRSFAQDLFHYSATYEIIKIRGADDGKNALHFKYAGSASAGGASRFDQRRFVRKNAAEVNEIALESKGQKNCNFHRFLNCQASKKSVEETERPSPMQQLREILESGYDPKADEIAKDLWNDVCEDLLDRYSNRLDMERSKVVDADQMHEALCTVTSEADHGVWVASPRVSLDNPAFSAAGDSLLEVLAGKIKDAEFGALITTLNVDADARGNSRIDTRLGPSRHQKWNTDLRHLRSPLVLTSTGSFVFLDESPLGERPLQGLVARFVGDESSKQGAKTLREMAAAMPVDIAKRLDPVLAWSPPREGGDTGHNIPDILTQVGDLLHDIDQSEEDSRRDLILEFLGWLERWSEHHSNAIDILVGDAVQEAAWKLIRNSKAHHPLAIGLAERQDAPKARLLPEILRIRLAIQSTHGCGRAAYTVVGIPDDAETDRDYRIVLGEVQEAFGDYPKTTRLVRSRSESRMGFVAAPGGMVLCASSLLHLLPLRQRRNKGVAIGLLVHGQGAMRLGFDLAEFHYPGLTNALGESFQPQAISYSPPVAPNLFDELLGESQKKYWSDDGNRGADSAKRLIAIQKGLPRWSFLDDILTLVGALDQKAIKARTDQQRVMQRLSYAFLKTAARDDLSGAHRRLAELWLEKRRLLPACVMADKLHDNHWLNTPLLRKLAICLARRTTPQLTQDDLDALAEPSQVVQVLAALLMIEMRAGGLVPQLIFLDAEPNKTGALEKFVACLGRFRMIEPTTALDFGHILGSRNETEKLEDIRSRLNLLTSRERDRSTANMASSVAALHNEIHALSNKGLAKTRDDIGVPSPDAFLNILDEILRRNWDTTKKEVRVAKLKALLSGDMGDLGINLNESVSLDGVTLDPENVAKRYWERKHQEMQRRTGKDPVNVRRGGRFTQSALRKIMTLVIEELAPATRPVPSKEQQDLEDAARTLINNGPKAIPSGAEWLYAALEDRLSDMRACEFLWDQPWAFPTVSESSVENPDWSRLQEQILEREFTVESGMADVITWYLEQVRLPKQMSGSHVSGPIYELRAILERIAPDMGEEVYDEAVNAFEKSAARLTNEARKRVTGYLAFLKWSPVTSISLQELPREIERKISDIDFGIQAHDLDTLTLSIEELLDRLDSALREFESCWGRFKERWKKENTTDRAVQEQGLKVLNETQLVDKVCLIPSLFKGYRTYRPNVYNAMLRYDARFAQDFIVGRNLAFDPVQAGGAPLLNLVRQLRENFADKEAPVAWTIDQVLSAACGFFLGSEPSQALATARLDEDIWKITFGAGDLAPLIQDFDDSRVHLKLPLTLAAERHLRADAGFALEIEPSIILAPFLADGIPGRRILRANELARAATMERNDRGLYLWYQLNRETKEWPDEILETQNVERLVAHLLRLVRTDPSEDAPGLPVLIDELPQILARLCLAFRWGSFDENSRRILTEPQVYRICEELTRLEEHRGASLEAGELLLLLEKLKK